MKLSIHSAQNTAFSSVYLYFKYIFILGPGDAPSVLLYFYTQHSILKPAILIMPQPQGSWQSVKKCVMGGGGGVFPENVPMTFLVGESAVCLFIEQTFLVEKQNKLAEIIKYYPQR